MLDLDALAPLVESALYREGGRRQGDRIRFRCPIPTRHKGGDRHPSADYSVSRQSWVCRSCGASGGLVVGDHPLAPLLGVSNAGLLDPETVEQLKRDRIEAERRRAKAEADEAKALAAYWEAHERRMTAEEWAALLDELRGEGVSAEAAEHFGLEAGSYHGKPAMLIPWTIGGRITALQYRLRVDDEGGRYRWRPGSRPSLYNGDAAVAPHDDELVVVEGAKKVASLWGHGVTSIVGIANKSAWRPEWGPLLSTRFRRIVFALDPDATREAVEAARTVGESARVAQLPMKPDDLLRESGGNVDLLARFLELAVRVR